MLYVDLIKVYVNIYISCIVIILFNKLYVVNKNDFFVNINDLYDRFYILYFFLFCKRNFILVFL